MTSTTLSYLEAIGGAATLIIPALQLMHNKERGKYLKRITPIGWGIIILAAYIIATAFISIGVNKKEKKADENDLVDKMSNKFAKALEKFGKTYDPKTNTIHDTQSVFITQKPATIREVNETPELIVYQTDPNPIVTIDKGDTAIIIYLGSLRNISYIKSYRFLIFKIENDIIINRPEITLGHYRESLKQIIPNDNTPWGLWFFINHMTYNHKDFIFVIEILYENNKKHLQPIFRKIYRVYRSTSSYEVGNIQDNVYDKVSEWIVNKGY